MNTSNNKKHINTHFIALLLSLMLTLSLLSGCGKKGDETCTLTATELLAHVINSTDSTLAYEYEYSDGIPALSCADLLNSFYKFDTKAVNSISSAAIARLSGVSADELVIIKTSDTAHIEDLLKAHVDTRMGDFIGYAPDEMTKLEHAEIVVTADYVALFISNKSAEAKTAYKNCFKDSYSLSEKEKSIVAKITGNQNTANNSTNTTDTNTESESGTTTNQEITSEVDTNNEVNNDNTSEDGLNTTESTATEDTAITTTEEPVLIDEIPGVIVPYDTSMIVKAYKDNNKDLLTDPKDIEVFEVCTKAISELITADMTDYQKEIAIHDYIVNRTAYDSYALAYSDKYQQYSDQPYGTLIQKSAICLGYSSTFKMFMDMLDIECIIVKGSAHSNNANHAWNLVKLEDDWYAVDVTWDDPVTAIPTLSHEYFNITDNALQKSNHHWNKDDYPAANGGKYSVIQNLPVQ